MDSLIVQLSESVSSAQTLEELARPMLEMLEAVTGCESTYLTAIDLEGGVQQIVIARNSKQLQIPEGLSVPWDDTLCKRALDEGRPYTNDVAECWGDSDAARQLGIRTYVSTPVRADGDLYGTLCAASSAQLPLPPNAQHVLQLFSRLIGQHMERERLLTQLRVANAQLVTSTLTDTLTGLPNRRMLLEELGQLLARGARSGTTVLVGFVDLDDFKAINDSYGHDCGDDFLRAIANRLNATLRAGDTLARLGGDEFVVVGPGPVRGPAADAAVQALEARLSLASTGDVVLRERTISYGGASVGVVAVDPKGSSVNDALKQADAAMYQVKHRRRSGASR